MNNESAPVTFPASGSHVMYHKVKRENGKIRMTGWMHPDTKAKVGDSIEGTFLTGKTTIMQIEEISYCDHPGIFGKYEMRKAEDSDKKIRTHLVDLEPEHPFKKNTRFDCLCFVTRQDI